MNATVYTTNTGLKAFRFNGETEEQANARYAAIDTYQNDIEVEDSASVETIDGVQVETAEIADLVTGDYVYRADLKMFVRIQENPFHTYVTDSSRTKIDKYGDWLLVWGGQRTYAKDGQSFTRVADPKAYEAAKTAKRRSLMDEIHGR